MATTLGTKVSSRFHVDEENGGESCLGRLRFALVDGGPRKDELAGFSKVRIGFVCLRTTFINVALSYFFSEKKGVVKFKGAYCDPDKRLWSGKSSILQTAHNVN